MVEDALVPSAEEQAEEILAELRDHPNADVPEGLTKADLIETIDEDRPVSVNLKAVIDGLGGLV